MSSPRLSPLSFVILTLVGDVGAGAHDIALSMQRGRLYWTAAPSQYYAEAKRLATLGLLDAEQQPGRTGPRTHYRMTDAGRDALRTWARTPAQFPKLLQEPAVRLLATDIVGTGAVLEGLAALRDDLAALDAELDDAEERAAGLPSRKTALRLNHRLSRRLVAAQREWLDEVEAEFGPEAG
ncbi:helix-turn-helix transcriptional regulator [Paraconexibacter antarcticus]|uniref:Helix-turn-helix transcriptional regulator n=1 Tax=Paraconexibacter antarcticus TaxID=2949664 RepID=A0ABY5DS30_9ACTN|nr:helix-turn-helix transcriptional regulator [Paraconexibacter antarcticus]UTI64838.1 helix-turn-helix transcriptional regulator [Paraconexibacter antarcticus]